MSRFVFAAQRRRVSEERMTETDAISGRRHPRSIRVLKVRLKREPRPNLRVREIPSIARLLRMRRSPCIAP